MSESPTHQLFLCHSSKDKAFVRRLSRDLSRLDTKVWLDEWQLTPGDSLHKCIGSALESSAYTGVVISPNSIQSKWCQAELDQALTKEKRKGEKVVIPLVYRKAPIPPFLEGRLYVQFGRAYLKALAQLAGFILGVSPQTISTYLTDTPPKSLLELEVGLNKLRNPGGLKVIEAPDYIALQTLFQKYDVPVDSKSFGLRFNDPPMHVLCVDEYWDPRPQKPELFKAFAPEVTVEINKMIEDTRRAAEEMKSQERTIKVRTGESPPDAGSSDGAPDTESTPRDP